MTAFHLTTSAFAVACLLLASQATAYTMQDMCAQWWEDGYIGNPTDCTGWGYCKAQKLISAGTCESGLVYEPQSQTCQSASSCACTTSGAKTCTALKTAGYVAEPSDCNKFSYCFGNGKSATSSCPTGQKFAANNNTCVWATTCPQDTICRFMKNNIYVGDPNNCGQYLHCVKGNGVWGSCGINKHYNAALGVCQSNNPCTDQAEPNPGDPNLPSPTLENCPTDGYVPDGKTCYGFYLCEGGKGKWGQCPFGLEFNEKSSKCGSPAAIACPFDRCANTNLTYAAVAGTSCMSYTYCPNGSVGYCTSPNFKFFDEIAKECVSSKPDYPVCNDTPTNQGRT